MADDERDFGAAAVDPLRRAVADLSWLLDRAYPETASLQLVGDRHGLGARQRTAVRRASCSEAERTDRASRRTSPEDLRGATVWVDAYNVLVTVSTALAGGVVIAARDGAYRDLAGLSREISEPLAATPVLERVGHRLAELGPAGCVWHLDRPVSRSGRLRASIQRLGTRHGWSWQALVVPDPDPVLSASPAGTIVATADSAVIDRCGRWFALARHVVEREVPGARVIDLAAIPVPD